MLIFTKFLPGTNTKPPRVKASTHDQSVCIESLTLDRYDDHRRAVLALVDKYHLGLEHWHYESYDSGYAWMSYTPSPCTCNCTGDCYAAEESELAVD